MRRDLKTTLRRRAWLSGSVLAVVSIVAASGCGTPSDPAAARTVTVAEQSVAGMTTGLWPHLAEELGYFADEGITVEEYVSVKTGSDAISGMQSGAVNVSHTGVEGLTAAAKGADIVGIAAGMDASIWTVVAAPDIASWSQLKGKTIALGSVSDITRVVFGQLAQQAGLDPERDLKFVALGPTPQRIAAVQNGQVAATIATYPPAADALASGGVRDLGFAPPGKTPPKLMTTDIEASKTWAEQNPDVAAGYLRAITRAVQYVRDPSNKSDSVARIARLSRNSPDAVAKALEVYFHQPVVDNAYFPRNFRHAPEVFDATVQAYVDLGLLDERVSQDEYMDYRYLDQALSR